MMFKIDLDENGMPCDKSYLEHGLPEDLVESITLLKAVD